MLYRLCKITRGNQMLKVLRYVELWLVRKNTVHCFWYDSSIQRQFWDFNDRCMMFLFSFSSRSVVCCSFENNCTMSKNAKTLIMQGIRWELLNFPKLYITDVCAWEDNSHLTSSSSRAVVYSAVKFLMCPL